MVSPTGRRRLNVAVADGVVTYVGPDRPGARETVDASRAAGDARRRRHPRAPDGPRQHRARGLPDRHQSRPRPPGSRPSSSTRTARRSGTCRGPARQARPPAGPVQRRLRAGGARLARAAPTAVADLWRGRGLVLQGLHLHHARRAGPRRRRAEGAPRGHGAVRRGQPDALRGRVPDRERRVAAPRSRAATTTASCPTGATGTRSWWPPPSPALLVRRTGARATVAHVSNPEVASYLAPSGRGGRPSRAEGCPQYFLLREDEVHEHGALRKFTPPARARTDEDEREMWRPAPARAC